MSFTPPLFSKFSKKANDLFDKEYNFKTFELTSKNKTANGVTFETKADLHGSGSIKTKSKITDVGEAEFTLATKSSGNKGKVKFDQLADNLTLTVNGANKKGPSVSVDAEYTQDFFSGMFGLKSGHPFTPALNFSGVIGTEGLSVGGGAHYCSKKGLEYDVGVQYDDSDFSATLMTTSNAANMEFGYHHKVCANYQLAAKLTHDIDGNSSMCGGFQYKLDGNTTLKGKSCFPSKMLSFNLQHNLASPKLQLGLSASFLDGKNGLESQDWGINMTLGDY